MDGMYECHRSEANPQLHLIFRAGECDRLPPAAKRGGPWSSLNKGLFIRLKPEYRLWIVREGFVRIVGPRFSEFRVEV